MRPHAKTIKSIGYIRLVSIIAFGIMIVGCGSSGGGGETQAGNPDLTGIFIESAVEGVNYTTSSGLTGTTDSSGTFTYKAGDLVSFNLSGIFLGQARGASEITVLDIVGANQPSNSQINEWLSDSEMNNGENALIKRALNISLLLQTLDEDSDPNNGIEITIATADSRPPTVLCLLPSVFFTFYHSLPYHQDWRSFTFATCPSPGDILDTE